jgi:hypothetical protein
MSDPAGAEPGLVLCLLRGLGEGVLWNSPAAAPTDAVGSRFPGVDEDRVREATVSIPFGGAFGGGLATGAVEDEAEETCEDANGGGGLTFSLPLKHVFAVATLWPTGLVLRLAVELVAGITSDVSP